MHRWYPLPVILLVLATTVGPLSACEVPVCPASPNCVASGDPDPDRRLAEFRLAVAPELAWPAVTAAVGALPRATLVAEGGGPSGASPASTTSGQALDTGAGEPWRLVATVESALLAFVDDLLVVYCPARRTLLLRSASRSGYWDMGVNRERVAGLLSTLTAKGILEPAPLEPAPHANR